MGFIEFDVHDKSVALTPVIGVLNTDYAASGYRYRFVFWWLVWQISIGVGRRRYG